MTKLLSVATAAVHPDQLSDTAHLHFPRVDYIELHRLLDAEMLDQPSVKRRLVVHESDVPAREA